MSQFPWHRAKLVTLDDFQPTEEEQEKQREEQERREVEREKTQPRFITNLFDLPAHHSTK